MLHQIQFFYILLSFALSLLIHFLVIQVTHRKGIFLDEHDKVQKVHDAPTPRIGGLGIFLSSMFILNDYSVGGYLILAAIPAFIAGFLEDYSGKISPEQRLAIMCLSPVMAFIMIPDSVLTQWSFLEVPVALGIVASVIFIIALVNGVNFTDGQNGLASGTVFLCFLSLGAVAFLLNDSSILYICAVLAAAVAAFLVYNFPAGRIFLGDGGAYLLGFMIAAISIVVVQRHPTEVSPFLLPAILIYPLWEVLFSTCRKFFYDRISPLRSDEYHLHQLLFRNHSRGKGYLPVLLILPAQLISSCFVIAAPDNELLLLLIMLIYILVYTTVYFYERRLDKNRGRVSVMRVTSSK